MASSARVNRLLKAMGHLSKRTTFDYGTVLKKVKLTSSLNGTLQGTFTIDKTMCNMGGTLHGGYIASVIDVLSFYTQLSNTDGRVSWTTNMNVKYIAAAMDGEKINVTTKAVANGNTTEVKTHFHNEEGKLLAIGTSSFLSGPEHYQELVKDLLDFNVYDKE